MKGICELIETLWNVNLINDEARNAKLTELIETLWNVNITALITRRTGVNRINRNIVECKFVSDNPKLLAAL